VWLWAAGHRHPEVREPRSLQHLAQPRTVPRAGTFGVGVQLGGGDLGRYGTFQRAGTLQRRFLSTGGTIYTDGDRISVRLDRRT